MRGSAVKALLASGLAAVIALAVCGAPARAQPAPAPYLDPRLPIADRVRDLLARMSLDDKLGQMAQPERKYVTPDDVTRYRIGAVLSSGGSAPSPNTPQ